MRSVDNNTAENSQITGAADRSGGEMGHVSGQVGLNNTTMTLELIDKAEEKDFPEMFTKNLGPVMEHSKEEVCEVLRGKATKTLVRCLVLSFGEMIVKLPKYAESKPQIR